MMPDHLSAAQIESYQDRRTPPEELIRIDDHISQCAECRERLASDNELRAALRGGDTPPSPGQPRHLSSTPFEGPPNSRHLKDMSTAFHQRSPQGEHLTYEQLEAYVDGTMPRAGREATQAHLEHCQTCSDDVRDLNTFKVELTDSKGRREKGTWVNLVALSITRRRIALTVAMAALVMVFVLEKWKSAPPHGVSPVGTVNSSSTGNESLVVIRALPPEDQSAVLEAISQQKIKSPDVLAGLRGPLQTLLGGPPEGLRFEVLEPLGEVVPEVCPVFRWQSLVGASTYSVAIFDLNLNPVQSSPPLQATQWTTTRPLKRGQMYLWQVIARFNDGKSISSPSPPSPEARFRVLDQEKADELSQFQTAHSESHLVLGVLYAQAGILKQGEDELKKVRESDPDHKLAQDLLQSIEEIRHPQR